MSGTFTKSMARNIFYGGSVFFFLLFLVLTFDTTRALPERDNREAITPENAMPSGTTMAYRQAKREPPEVAEKWISEDIRAGRWEGYTPPPLPMDGKEE